MKISKLQLRRIIREEKNSLLRESYMKRRYTEMGDVITSVIESEPGISGADIVDLVHYEYPKNRNEMPVGKEEVFAILDDMLEDGAVFLDEEEDAWFNTEEDLLAWREEGGAWSDEKDYHTGWKR